MAVDTLRAEVLTSDLTRDEALVLTERIKETAARAEATYDQAGELLLDAHDRGAWVPLGYETWKAYTDAEFRFSESHVFQLLRRARLERATREAIGLPPLMAVDCGAPQSDPVETEPIFTMRAIRPFKDDAPEDVAAEIAEEIAHGAGLNEALKIATARRSPNRHTPVSEHHVPLPVVKEVRADLRKLMADVRALIDSAPETGRGDVGMADEFCRWVAILSALSGKTKVGEELFTRIYQHRAEAFEHLMALGENKEGLSNISGIREVTVGWWIGRRRGGVIGHTEPL